MIYLRELPSPGMVYPDITVGDTTQQTRLLKKGVRRAFGDDTCMHEYEVLAEVRMTLCSIGLVSPLNALSVNLTFHPFVKLWIVS